MIFYLNFVVLMVVLGRVDAKKKTKPIINQYITNNYNNNSCTGTCNFGNVTNINNNITNIFKNESDDQPFYSPLKSYVAFTAYLHVGRAIIAGSQNTKIPFDRVTLNHGDAFDKTTGTFKAPVKGGYSLSCSVKAIGGHSNQAYAWIEVEQPDGTKGYYAATHADNYVVSSNTVNVELDKGASVSVYLYRNYKIYGSNFAKDTTFSGHLLYLA